MDIITGLVFLVFAIIIIAQIVISWQQHRRNAPIQRRLNGIIAEIETIVLNINKSGA